MHDRNIFKNDKPNFERLATEYKQFAPYVQKGSSGKCYVNFKDPASLRALSVVLLRKYFDLSIEIPLDRLIPTIPLRLNYIHWIEDLMKDVKNKEILGIDIGCGASCVYALLGNRINKWKFIVTEIDDDSQRYAQDNIKRNKMEESIKVLKVSKDGPPLCFAIDSTEEEKFDFCMCNPPFFKEVNETLTNRTDHRPPPDSISTASESESLTQGGEVEFVKKMIDDSLVIKGKVTWYTSMLGKKSSIKPIIRYLEKSDIKTHETTIFKQGKTMRWGVAWSFTETVIKKPSTKSGKKAKPFFLVPSDTFYHDNQIPLMTANMEVGRVSRIHLKIAEFISEELTKLRVPFEKATLIILQNRTAYEITGKAFENTWTHQRRKRREMKHGDNETTRVSNESVPVNTSENCLPVDEGSTDQIGENINKRKFCDIEGNDSNDPGGKRFCNDIATGKSYNDYKDGPTNDMDDTSKTGSPLFEFSCTVGQTSQFSLDTSKRIIISFLCLSGNRDIFYQMFMYFKNISMGTQLNLKLRV